MMAQVTDTRMMAPRAHPLMVRYVVARGAVYHSALFALRLCKSPIAFRPKATVSWLWQFSKPSGVNERNLRMVQAYLVTDARMHSSSLSLASRRAASIAC